MFALGDIVQVFAPTAGHKKYCLCIKPIAGAEAGAFLFLNSDPSFADTYAVDCAKVPCLKPSDTGKTVFAFDMIPRYSARQLKIYKAAKLGVIDPALAGEVYEFAKTVGTMPRADHAMVLGALKIISGG